MADNQKELSADEIRRLLQLLDDELTRRGHSATLYVVGGANISLALDNRRTTTDIDVVVKQGFDIVFGAAQAVAAHEPGLGADWLNSEFTGGTPSGGVAWSWFDNADSDIPSVIHSGKGLQVELASPQMMLALKVLAQRDKDMDDIHQLMRITGIRTPLELGRNLARFTGPRLFQKMGTDPYFHIHVDPEFAYIFASAPDDLRPPTPPKKPGLFDRLRAWRARRTEAKKTISQPAPLPRRAAQPDQDPRCGDHTKQGRRCILRAGHSGHHRGR